MKNKKFFISATFCGHIVFGLNTRSNMFFCDFFFIDEMVLELIPRISHVIIFPGMVFQKRISEGQSEIESPRTRDDRETEGWHNVLARTKLNAMLLSSNHKSDSIQTPCK